MKEILIQNKTLGLNYEILEKFEVGIVLFGFEVKSLKQKSGSLKGSYIKAFEKEVLLTGAYIPPYQPANTPESYDPCRDRKLLLHKKEIKKLLDLKKGKGLTIAPILVYNNGRNIKIEIAIVKGKRVHDKREVLKKKDAKRDIERTLKYS